MTTSIDFTTPIKTQNYDTGVLQSIRANMAAAASFMDTSLFTISAGAAAGMKRYNATSALFEQYNGSSWGAMPLAYLPLAGGTLTGALLLAGNATANLNPVPLQQLNSALSSYAPASALSSYAALAGASFTGAVGVAGNLSTGGSFGATGTIFSNQGIVANNAVTASNGQLTAANQFYLGAYNATTPFINFDSNDYIAFDRSGNRFTTYVAGAPRIQADASSISLYGSGTGALLWSSNSGNSDNYGGSFRFLNSYTSGGPYLRVNPSNGLEWVNSAYSAVTAHLDDNGAFTANGLLYGRGGGAGIGQVTVQSGGSPSGGAAGDLFLIY